MKRLISVSVISLLISSAPAMAADRSSFFNTDDELWRTANDAKNLTWISEGGNPGGFLEAEDISDGRIWYFKTPESWAGDWRNYKKLSFDLKQSSSTSPIVLDDVIVIGKNGNRLTWKGERPPSTSWTSYTLPLDNTTFKVTQRKFNGVMRNVQEVLIRGEFIGGYDKAGLDNVVLSETPAVVKGTVEGMGRYQIKCANKTTNQVIKKTGLVKLDWNCEALGLKVNDGDIISINIYGKAAK